MNSLLEQGVWAEHLLCIPPWVNEKKTCVSPKSYLLVELTDFEWWATVWNHIEAARTRVRKTIFFSKLFFSKF